MQRLLPIGLLSVSLILLASCEILQGLTGTGDKPTARITGVSLDKLDLTSTTLLFDVEVRNPYEVALPLVNLDYELASDGQSFLAGKADVQGSVPAGGSKTIPLPTRIVFADLLQAISGVQPGRVLPYTANLKLGVEAPAIGNVELPLRKSGELPIPTVPSVELAATEWKDLSFTEASAVLQVNVVNRNEFAVDLSTLTYALSLGDVSVVEGKLDEGQAFEPGGEQSLPIHVSFSPARLGLGAFNMLKGEGSSYRLAGTMNCDTPFGPLDFPYDRDGDTSFKGQE